MFDDTDLPDELREGGEGASAKSDSQTRLDALGVVVAAKRDAAIQARRESGIEEIWKDCEEAYLCIDDSNRAEWGKAKWAKPTAMNAPVTAETTQNNTGKSTAYVRVTARYVDAGAAKVSEIILPIDDKPFSFGPTPNPDLVMGQNDLNQVVENGEGLTRPARPDEVEGQNDPTARVPLTLKDLAEEKMEEASKRADKAEKRVADWLVECNYPAEMRKVLFDGSRIGVGLLKGPFPTVRNEQALSTVKGALALQIKRKVAPAVKWIDPWNFYPDPACGENIHDGDHCFERDFLTPGKLKALKKEKNSAGQPIYLSEQIDKVLTEGPSKCNIITEGGNPAVKKNDKRFDIWYMTGVLSREDMEAAGATGADELPEDVVEVFAIVTLVNDSVIRVTINPLDSGKLGYHALPWSRRAGHWAGVGVGEQVSLGQRITNSGTRALLNNAGLSAGIQLIINQGLIVPADGSWFVTPNKQWHLAPGQTIDDIRKAFMAVEFPNLGPQMMAIINFGFKLAEEASNIPLVSQGQVNADTPDTFGALELQNSNANTLLRDKAYAVDDHITVPLINDFYEYLLLDPSVPDDEKGDFEINARGSIAMVEKAIQEKTLMQMLGVALNPAYGADPKRVFNELLKTKRLDPRKVNYTEEEVKEQQSKQQPQPVQVQVATIRAQADMQKTDKVLAQKSTSDQLSAQTTMDRAKLDTDRDTVYVQAQTARDQATQELGIRKLVLQRELAIMEYASQHQLSLDDVRARLAETAMKLNTQKELSLAALGVDVHKHHNSGQQVITPPTEPVGRAPAGQSFEG